jgi:hypothetical protein
LAAPAVVLAPASRNAAAQSAATKPSRFNSHPSPENDPRPEPD